MLIANYPRTLSARTSPTAPPAAEPVSLAAMEDLADFRGAVLEGLSHRPRRLPCRFFYDHEGSQLFDAICDLPEYYLTRTEDEILRSRAPEIAALVPPDVSLVELGSGTARKTRHVIGALLNRQRALHYYPADICGEMLADSASGLRREFPRLAVTPVQGEYYAAMRALKRLVPGPRLCLFLGSNLGNFVPAEAARFLSAVRDLLEPDDFLLLSLDAQKPAEVLEAAYDDAAGITARFNLNLLQRINRELGGNFDVSAWQHHAFYSEALGRVEMHLRSRRAQRVTIGRTAFEFREGETIHTEDSHKYSRPQIESLARDARLNVEHVWSDERDWFRVVLLRPS